MKTNTMRRIAAALLALTMLALMSGCAKKDGDRLAQIKEKGTITIAMEGCWAPWTYHGDNDELTGFDVEVGKMIADKLGVTATFIEGEWDGLLAGVDAGRYDLVINGVDITEDRAAAYDFSDAYAYISTVVVVAADNEDIQSLEDLKGRTTANSIGSTYMEIAEANGATVSGVDTLDETIQMVEQGRVDATLNADQSIFDYLREHPDANIKIVCSAGEPNAIAIPMHKGDDTASLREAINKVLRELHASGDLAAASDKYFGTDITSK